ncbi:hypothetical protein E1B28_008982 [Marasmius oreades]|uniref:Uncharacterized protein n=1 Tax=Marasmius oreades TaxID=181124 RepID=A0A9P7USB3_9AGAR|nr:uncharacterized protein E1B28_008982 [Marasmius oreades]KAG7092642.1 hypothetical protein E1B28_008982 [Marasmius oreades]
MSLSPVAASAAAVLNLSNDGLRSASPSASPPALPDVLSEFSCQYPTMSSLPSPPLLTPDQVSSVSFNVDVNAMQTHLEIDPFALQEMAMDSAMVQDSHQLDPSATPAAAFSISSSQPESAYIAFNSTITPTLEQAMTIELPSSSTSSSVSSPLPNQIQIPSPSLSSIHTNVPSYGANVGVTATPSSLQSALSLDPAGGAAVGGLTSPNLASNVAPDRASGSSRVGSISFPMVQDLAVKKEDSALSLGGSMLEEIVKSASAAASLCRSGRGAEASKIVGDLGEKLAFVSDVISGMSGLTVGENGVTLSPSSHSPPHQVSHATPLHSFPHLLSQTPVFTTNSEYYPPSHPQQAPILIPIPESSQLIFSTGTGVTPDPDVNVPLPLSGSVQGGTSIPPSLSHTSASTPPGQESSRKRCASEIDVGRPIKALKAEPQEDLLYNTSQPGVPPKHANTLQSPPPSRPTTPPSVQTAFVFNPVKTPPHSQTTPYPPSTPSSQSSYGYNSATVSTPDLTAKVTAPVFPRSAWSESVVPTIGGQSRHSHSLSTGSITTPSSSGAGTGGSSPVSHTGSTSSASATTAVQTSPSRFSAGVNGRINGRMTRSGSIGTLGTHPFTYTYPSPSQLQPVIGSSRLDTTGGGTGPGSASSAPTTAKNSPEETHEGDDGDDGDDEAGRGGSTHATGSGSDVPQEYRSEVDRIFFEFLNKICSNLEATDAKGDPIHQTLMPKKMQRLDESPDFRPFKFRILAFTTAFLEELARQGYPEEKIPMKKIRNYLWRHPYIQRYNEDGKKAKSKGNYIWNVEARKTNNLNGQWEFRPFQRKLAGIPPVIAYCGLKWSWHPHIWDPQASFVSVPVHYSSPTLPSWLSWKGEELSGTPPAGAQSCDIRVDAKFILDGQEGHLSSTFHLNVAPRSSMDSGYSLPRSQSDTLLHQAPMRAAASRAATAHIAHSHSHTQHTTLSSVSSHPSHPVHSTIPSSHPSVVTSNSTENAPARVVEVLQNVAQRVTEEAANTTQIQHQIHATPVTPSATANANAVANHLQDLVKQKHAVEQSLVAYDRALTGPTPPETHRLAVAAQLVVAEAAQNVSPGGVTPLVAIQTASVGDMTDGVQEALAVAVQAVKMQIAGHASDLEVIEVTRSLLASKNSSANAATGSGAPMNGVISTGTAIQSGQVNMPSTGTMAVPNPYPPAYPVSSYV